MLRITPAENGNHHQVLKLEGRVAGPWVTELWKACDKVLNEGKALKLDMAEVSFLDPAGVTLLSKLQVQGIELTQCPPFVAEQLKAAEDA